MDDRGIPTTHQEDGTPNGYHVMDVRGNKITLRYKASGCPATYQMRISLDTAFHQFSKNGIRDYRMGQLLGDRIDLEQLSLHRNRREPLRRRAEDEAQVQEGTAPCGP